MKRALFSLALAACCGFAAHAFAATPAPMATPKVPDMPLPAERAFVAQVTTDLNARYPNPAAAEQAGYFRYNNEDSTGAISYVNLADWNSAADPSKPQPSQVWYDVHGRLLGADFSIPLTAANSSVPPNIWNINPNRWFKVSRAHVHYVLSGSTNAAFGHAVRAADYTKAGGSLEAPTAAPLVKLGKIQSAAIVQKVFTFPAQWNLELWVTPNPLGAFAEKNPLVHPSKNASKGEM